VKWLILGADTKADLGALEYLPFFQEVSIAWSNNKQVNSMD
jgi:hypothetical protein